MAGVDGTGDREDFATGLVAGTDCRACIVVAVVVVVVVAVVVVDSSDDDDCKGLAC